jgi:hypothetical protein
MEVITEWAANRGVKAQFRAKESGVLPVKPDTRRVAIVL